VSERYRHIEAQEAYEQLFQHARPHVWEWGRGRLEPRSRVLYSSQSLCISLFGALAALPPATRDAILLAIAEASGMASPPFNGTGATIECEERQHRAILGEIGGGTPTALDALITWPGGVLTLESKFCESAFSVCSQPRTASDQNPVDATGKRLANCSGIYAEGSDRKPTTAAMRVPCRLTVRDGRRQRRRYWDVAPALFAGEMLTVPQSPCPFRDDSYQLMRNLAFAYEWSRQQKELAIWFGLLVVHVRQSDHFATLKAHYAKFVEMLRPEVRPCVGRIAYEDVAEILDGHGQGDLAYWIRHRIDAGLAALAAERAST
jgi:hypothetical protein